MELLEPAYVELVDLWDSAIGNVTSKCCIECTTSVGWICLILGLGPLFTLELSGSSILGVFLGPSRTPRRGMVHPNAPRPSPNEVFEIN